MALDYSLSERIKEEDTYRYTIADILQIRAKFTPDFTAYIFLKDGEDNEERLTYRELENGVGAIAQQFNDLNLRGERALMLYPPGLDYIRSLFACFYSGVIAVPAYPPRKNRSLDRLRTLVIDSGASIVLTTCEIHQSFEWSFQDVEELKSLKWLSTDKISSSPLPPFPQPLDVALLQYTSGSTGQPKGVMVTHRNIIRNLEFIRQSFKLTSKSVSVTWLPSFHDMGLIDGVMEPIYTGMPGVIIPPVNFLQKPVRWLKAIAKYKGSHSGGPNFAFDLCVDGISEEERMGLDLSSMETLYCGAEPIRKTTFERFAEAYKDFGFRATSLYPCYGMAETTLITSGPHAGRGPVFLGLSGKALKQNKIKPVSSHEKDITFLVGVGYPWLDTEVRIVNPDTLEHCKEDEVGEIWVSGSVVTAGYWNKKELTEEVFKASIQKDPSGPYLRTGDLGFFHEGELYVSGRLKDLVIIHGRNYYPQDIEFIAEKSHNSLRPNASAAFSVDINEEERLIIVAEVERTAMRGLDTEAVCDAIRRRISEEYELEVYGIQLLRTASILKTSSGKIQRKASKEAYLGKTLEVVGESFMDFSQSSSANESTNTDLITIQAWLMTWIHTRLKIPLERIDFTKPITVYGLSSMKAIQLQQDFLQKYGVNFPPYLFFEKISVRDLCERALKLISEK
jgi:acyl-CoA synthetase (AMP-forming)/AMP-acid ligase II